MSAAARPRSSIRRPNSPTSSACRWWRSFSISLGWRWGFGITACLFSLAYFSAAYWFIYRDPSQDKRLSKAEHDYILAGGATPEGLARRGRSACWVTC